MYDIEFKNNSISLSYLDADNKEAEIIYDLFSTDYRVKVIFPEMDNICVDGGYNMDEIFVHEDGYIELYENVDYKSVKIYVDPDKYRLEADYDKKENILIVYVKRKEK